MSKETLEYVVTKAKELIAAPSCSAEAKEAAQAWIAAVGTDKQAEETKKFIAEMEEDIIPIDRSHSQSPMQEQKYLVERKEPKV